MHEGEQCWLQMQPFPYSPLLLEVFQVHCPHGLFLLLSKERAAKSLYSYDHPLIIAPWDMPDGHASEQAFSMFN